MVMFRVDLSAWSQKVRPFRTPALVVAISALVALLFTIATRPADEVRPRAAGEASIQLLNDEHARVAAFVRGLEEAAKAEQIAVVRERREMQAIALAEPKPDPVPVTAQPARIPVRAVAAVAPKPGVVIGPPLQLAAAAPSLTPQRPEPPRRPVVERARAVIATVERIPGWVRAGVENVTDWAVSAPSRAISQLPERRFL
jgi:hypothetical protein